MNADTLEFCDLPNEICLQIFLCLPIKSVFNIFLSNKRFHDLINHDFFWRTKLEQHFSNDVHVDVTDLPKEHSTWKTYFKEVFERQDWHWDKKKMEKNYRISEDAKIATQTEYAHSMVLTTEPIPKNKISRIRIKLNKSMKDRSSVSYSYCIGITRNHKDEGVSYYCVPYLYLNAPDSYHPFFFLWYDGFKGVRRIGYDHLVESKLPVCTENGFGVEEVISLVCDRKKGVLTAKTGERDLGVFRNKRILKGDNWYWGVYCLCPDDRFEILM